MVPLQMYRAGTISLSKPSSWNLIDPGMLSPWNMMSWGLKQLKGVVVGSGSAGHLQAQDLVLVENLKVWVLMR